MTPDSRAAFPPTRWSMVLAARQDGDHGNGRRALNELCAIYWQPVYSFARRRGHSPQDAEDLAQGFFLRVIDESLLGKADATQGKLRSFLLGAFQRYQREEWRKDTALKRGGGAVIFSMNSHEAEAAFKAEDPSVASPEEEFERRCALALLEAAMKKLGAEQSALGRGKAFEQLRPLLSPSSGGDDAQSHATLAASLGLTEEASRAAVYRLRKRFREILRDVVADTLENPTEAAVDEELLALRSALG